MPNKKTKKVTVKKKLGKKTLKKTLTVDKKSAKKKKVVHEEDVDTKEPVVDLDELDMGSIAEDEHNDSVDEDEFFGDVDDEDIYPPQDGGL